MNIFIKTSFIFILLFLLRLATPVFAADVFLDAKNQSFAQDEEFLVNVFLNTEEESVNAIEGKLVFPADLLEVREIRDGNSIINFWIEKPHIFQPGAIVFSGITPGGLSGPKELLFSVVFLAKKDGSGTIQTDGLRVLRNDGEGTPARVKVSPFEFVVAQDAPAARSIIEALKDTDLPEDFKLKIVSDPNIFDGKYFVVFVTQDKGSGIDHYEVCEGSREKCVITESPYLLENQELDQKIFVKAIDKNGNERIVMLPPQKPLPWYKNYIILAMLIIGLIVGGVILRKFLWRKFLKSR